MLDRLIYDYRYTPYFGCEIGSGNGQNMVSDYNMTYMYITDSNYRISKQNYTEFIN